MKKAHRGLFKLGNSGGPGRPKRQTESAYLGAMMQACSLDDWQSIVAQAVADAKTGDAKSREWLGRYLVGEPATKAPAPLQVIVQQLLQADDALDMAAKRLAAPLVSDMQLPDLEDTQQAELEEQARTAILAHDPLAG